MHRDRGRFPVSLQVMQDSSGRSQVEGEGMCSTELWTTGPVSSGVSPWNNQAYEHSITLWSRGDKTTSLERHGMGSSGQSLQRRVPNEGCRVMVQQHC